MVALAADRATKSSDAPNFIDLPVAAGVRIFNGAMVAIDSSGWARPARTSTTDRVLGFNKDGDVNNTSGANGAVRVRVQRGQIAYFVNNAGSVVASSIGGDCFAVDDQTVDATNGTNTRVRAGKVFSVDATEGVGVLFDQ